jgi:hypothetical protein
MPAVHNFAGVRFSITVADPRFRFQARELIHGQVAAGFWGSPAEPRRAGERRCDSVRAGLVPLLQVTIG